jgi:catechol 2,3-dioxygenase-like lactoylglutathione lyase family enzyme
MAFISAIPKLASLDIQRSIAFFEKLGFTKAAHYPDYGIVQQDAVQIHFWLCTDAAIPRSTGCRINVSDIEALFANYSKLGVIHPNDPLSLKPWGLREFSILDADGNLVTFAE